MNESGEVTDCHCDSNNYFNNFINRKKSLTKSHSSEDQHHCFRFFDKNSDGILDTQEFHQLCTELFHNQDNGQTWRIEDTERVLSILNKEGSHIDISVFESLWNRWIIPVLAPKCALVVIDVQNDFISGSLALTKSPAKQDGAEVVPVINRIIETTEFEKIIYSYDWHPHDHISFHENRHLRSAHSSSQVLPEEAQVFDTVVFDVDESEPIEQILWPTHCVQETNGAKLHKELKVVEDYIQAYKGTNPIQDNYSVLYPTPEPNNSTSGDALATKLRDLGVTDLFLCGIALDICVASTAFDARRLGFRTIVVEDACRGVDDQRIRNTRRKLEGAGCVFVQSKEVDEMVSGVRRHPGLALTLAGNIVADDHANSPE